MRVSVIIPTFNRAGLVGETLDSLLAQTMQDLEAVVVDDGSADDTAGVVAGYAPRIRYVAQQNTGCAGASNRGIRETAAPYILILGSDDKLAPDCLAVLADRLDEHPDAGMAYGGYDEFGEGARAGDCFERWPPADGMIALKILRQCFFTAACSVMFRRTCVDEAGPFDEELGFAEDFDLWLRLAARRPAVCVRRVLSHVRASRQSKSRNVETIVQNELTKARIIERFLREHPAAAAELPQRERARIAARPYFDAGVWALRHRRRRDARRHLRAFLARYKFYPQGYWYYALSFCPWPLAEWFAGRVEHPQQEDEIPFGL